MASSFNAKAVHKDGKAELKIGIDENAKILDGVGETLRITNPDGTPAVISVENIPCIPENASATNKLVTQQDLIEMNEKITKALESTVETAQLLMQLGNIVGNLNEE